MYEEGHIPIIPDRGADRMIIHLILRVIFLLGVAGAFWLEFERE
jgi:hypothetical protein